MYKNYENNFYMYKFFPFAPPSVFRAYFGFAQKLKRV
jgi:hypothetical protein